jgi:Mce-associated membrane protein
VEDQPAQSGDLTPEADDTPQGKAARRRHRLLRHEAAKIAAAQEDTEDDGTEAVQPPVLAAHRPVGRGLIAAGIVASALFVGGAAFGGAQLQPYLADRALVHNKFEVAQTAAEAVSTLWSYTPQSMDSLAERSQRFLSRDFADQYRKFIDSIVSSNKQAQITNQTQVVGAAVESIGPNNATAIVYTNSVSTSPLSKGVPSLRYLSYRLRLQRRGGDWLVNQMTALTQLDLTPQL